MEIKAGRGLVVLSALVMMVLQTGEAQLSENFYNKTCPNVESIVRLAVEAKFNQTFFAAQATLHLFFHDCFVQGCDASVLIYSPKGDAEKDAPDNQSLSGDGFDTVAKAKAAVESKCPGVVSCADILALATRDVVVLMGGPSFQVELGRKDGLVSLASDVPGNLPEPDMDVAQLAAIFAKNGLNISDMVTLSGGHTIGASHCNQFSNRLYNFSSSSPTDPSLNSTYAKQLKASCPKNASADVVMTMDPSSPIIFDIGYYKNLLAGMGLFTSDQVLFTNATTRPQVINFANNTDAFFRAFTVSMRKMGRVGVKTGKNGNIRKDCSRFN